MTSTLPNQSATWIAHLESFEDWCIRDGRKFNSRKTALLCYLDGQLKLIERELVPVTFNSPIVGVISYLDENHPRALELLYARLALTLQDDTTQAEALISGHRLQKGLHPDYVLATRCYGEQKKTA